MPWVSLFYSVTATCFDNKTPARRIELLLSLSASPTYATKPSWISTSVVSGSQLLSVCLRSPLLASNSLVLLLDGKTSTTRIPENSWQLRELPDRTRIWLLLDQSLVCPIWHCIFPSTCPLITADLAQTIGGAHFTCGINDHKNTTVVAGQPVSVVFAKRVPQRSCADHVGWGVWPSSILYWVRPHLIDNCDLSPRQQQRPTRLGTQSSNVVMVTPVSRALTRPPRALSSVSSASYRVGDILLLRARNKLRCPASMRM